MEQNALLGTPAGALGLLYLWSACGHWRPQTVTRAREGGRGAGVLIKHFWLSDMCCRLVLMTSWAGRHGPIQRDQVTRPMSHSQ